MMKAKRKNVFLIIFSMIFVLSLSCFMAIIPAKAANPEPVTDIIMDTEASVRKDKLEAGSKSGIRFTAVVDNSYFENGALKENTVAGIIVTKGNNIAASTLTHESNKTGGAYAGAVLDIPADVWDSTKDTTTGKGFNAVVWNIPNTKYGEELTARGYVGTRADETSAYEYVYSDDVCVRNVAQVASKALANGIEDPYGTLAAYVDGVNPTITVDGDAETTMAIEKEVGANLSIAVEPSYLTPVITTENKFVDIKDNKILVRKYDANNTQETVTIKLGNTTKTVQITAKNEFKDGNLAENVLADFDENYYPSYGIKQGAGVTHSYMDVRHFDVKAAQAAGVDADSGIVGINVYGSYDAVVVPFGKTLTVSEISGIYIKIWVDEATANKNSVYIKINGNEKKASNAATTQGVNLVANSWNYIYVSRARLKASDGYNAATISEIEMYVQGTPRFWWYIDEVGILDNIAQENELINFDSAADMQTNFPWGGTVTYLSATDSACPTGATGGVAKFTTTGASGTLFYFKRYLNMSQVSKIIVRAYIPSSNPMRWWSVSSTGGYSSANWTIAAQNGQFYNYEIDVSTQWATTDNSVCGIRLHTNSADTWYIDSITYVAK